MLCSIYAINPDGTKKWEFETGDSVESSPAIGVDGTIYVGSHDHKLYAINPDGTKKWEFATESHVGSSPAIEVDGTVYVGSLYANKFYAINPDGTKKWEFATGDLASSSAAIGFDGTIYVGSYDKKLYAINPDGTKKWEFATEGIITSSPAINSDGTIYVGSWDNKLYAIAQSLTGTNTPPIASFTVSPSSGPVGTTYTVDASSSTDKEDPTSALQVRWDWENDGSWDTPYTTVKTASHQYPTAGTKIIRLEVKDTDGATDTTTRDISVFDTGSEVTVIQQDLTHDGTIDIKMDNGKVWIQINGDSENGYNYYSAGGRSGQSSYTKPNGNWGMFVDEYISGVIPNTVELIKNTPEVAAYRVTHIQGTTPDKQIMVTATIILPKDKEYAVFQTTFRNIGSSTFTYDEYPTHIHDGAAFGSLIPVNPDKFTVYGYSEQIFDSVNVWSVYSPSPTKPFVSIYDNTEGMTFGFIQPWTTNPNQFVTGGPTGYIPPSTCLDSMVREFTLNPGGTATYRGLIAFHTGAVSTGVSLYDDAEVNIDDIINSLGVASISGKVTESDGMTAIEGATVLALDGTGTVIGSTTTSAAGTYSITGLPEGTYTARASKSGYLATETSGVVIKASTETTGVNFILYSAKIKPIVSSPQSAGSEVWVKIQVGDEGEPVEDLHHLKFNLHYTNFEILDVLEVKHGGFLGDDPIFQEDHSSPGTVTVFIGRKPTDQGVTGYGNVVLVKFKLSAEAQPGTISVSFSQVEAYGTQSWVSLLPESDEFVTNRVTIRPELSSPQPAGVEFLLTIQGGDEDNQVTELSNVVYELVWDRPDIIQVVKPLYKNITAGEFIGIDSLILTGGGNGTLSICVARKGGGVNGYGTMTNIWLKVLDQAKIGEEIKFTVHQVSAYGSESNRIGLASGSCTLTVDLGIDTAEVCPGDTDNDGIVALGDIIPILYYWYLHAAGPARWPDETPLEIRIKWEKQLAIKWGIVIPPFPDACYADTDGNGIVEPEDIIAVAVNWGKTPDRRLMMPAPARAMSIYEIDHSKFIKCYEEMLAVLTGLPDNTPGKKEVEKQICEFIKISNPAIFKVYPNPYRPSISQGIKFENLGTNWNIKIYNIAGELVSEMHGTDNDYIWLTAKDFASGVYIYIINSSTLSKKTGKLAIIK
ncbi:MAG: PQQ-binding-like beta-propeller repeat protein [bacterium]